MKVRASVEFDLEVNTEINDNLSDDERNKLLRDLENEVLAKLPIKVDIPFRYEKATGDPMLVLIQKIDDKGYFEEILLDY